MRRSAALLLTLGLALASPALADPAKPEPARKRADCFFADNVRGYEVIDDKTVNVRIGSKEVFELTLFYPAFDLDISTRIGVKARGGSRICSPLDGSVIVPETGGPREYPIKAIRRLSLEEIDAGKPKPKAKS